MANTETPKDRATLNDARSQIAPDAPPSDKKPCPRMKRLRLGVFFDGTGNNRFRDEALGRETNVVRLWRLYKDTDDDFAVRKKYYLIGVGAVDSANESPDAKDDPERKMQATGQDRSTTPPPPTTRRWRPPASRGSTSGCSPARTTAPARRSARAWPSAPRSASTWPTSGSRPGSRSTTPTTR